MILSDEEENTSEYVQSNASTLDSNPEIFAVIKKHNQTTGNLNSRELKNYDELSSSEDENNNNGIEVN